MTAVASQGGPPIRVGLIGFGGHMAENLYPAIRLSADFRITSIAAREPCRAADLAQRLGIEHAAPSWQSLLDRELADAVIVAAPPEVHAEVIAAALPAGMHVFAEKPPAPDPRSLAELIAIESAHRNTVAFVDFNFRYGGILMDVQRRLAERSALRLAKIRMVASKPVTPLWRCASVEESFLYAVGIHAIDLALWLFGEPVEVAATRSTLGGARFSLAVILTFAGGGTAVLDLGNYSNRFEAEFELIGEGGMVARIDDLRQATFYGFAGSGRPLYSDKETTTYAYPGLKGGFVHSGYDGALRAFADAIRSAGVGRWGGDCLARVGPTYRIIGQILAAIDGERP
jgi:predicted dehydrogenase